MAPARKTLSLWRGNSKTFMFRLKQSDDTPVDLTGAKVVMTIVHEGGRIIASSDTDSGMIDDPVSGEVTVKLSAAVTRTICPSRIDGVRYELEIQTADEQRTLLAGKIEIEGGDNGD